MWTSEDRHAPRAARGLPRGLCSSGRWSLRPRGDTPVYAEGEDYLNYVWHNIGGFDIRLESCSSASQGLRGGRAGRDRRVDHAQGRVPEERVLRRSRALSGRVRRHGRVRRQGDGLLGARRRRDHLRSPGRGGGSAEDRSLTLPGAARSVWRPARTSSSSSTFRAASSSSTTCSSASRRAPWSRRAGAASRRCTGSRCRAPTSVTGGAMRLLTVVAAVLSALSLGASAGDTDPTRVDVGDPPRTYSHFLNAHEAALCRAGAATGGIESYFLNPACVSGGAGEVSGQGTIRFVAMSRDYLPEGDGALDASDGALLFSQAVAVKRSGTWVFGFGYSAPSYRNLELTGERADTARGHAVRTKARSRRGCGSSRPCSRTSVGKDGRGAVGIAAGVVNLSESAREVEEEVLDTAEVNGHGRIDRRGLHVRCHGGRHAGRRLQVELADRRAWVTGTTSRAGPGPRRPSRPPWPASPCGRRAC